MYCFEILLKAKFKADTELVGGLRHLGVEGGVCVVVSDWPILDVCCLVFI